MPGSAFIPVCKPLLAPTSGQVTLNRGNSPFSITNQVILASNNTITPIKAGENTNKLALTNSKTTGAINGTFDNPSKPHQSITVKSVVLHNQTNACGYLLSAIRSGEFLWKALDPGRTIEN
jgi:hypothetical protein